MSLVNWVYVVEYDLPTSNPSRRAYFYEKVHTMLNKYYGKDKVRLSTFSCYISEDEELAKKFFGIATEFCTRATIYKAQELERFKK